MSGDPDLKELTRVIRHLNHDIQEFLRLIAILNANIVEVGKLLKEKKEV